MTQNHSVARSLQMYEQAGKLIPGWTQLISRRSSQFAHGNSPIYAQRAKGARFIDVDENEYIDWVNAVGAIILGHADEVVNTAVKEQIDGGNNKEQRPQRFIFPHASQNSTNRGQKRFATLFTLFLWLLRYAHQPQHHR